MPPNWSWRYKITISFNVHCVIPWAWNIDYNSTLRKTFAKHMEILETWYCKFCHIWSYVNCSFLICICWFIGASSNWSWSYKMTIKFLTWIVWCHGLVILVAIQLWEDLLLNTWKYWRLGITSQKCWGMMKKQGRTNFAWSWQFDVQHGMLKLCMKSNFKATMEPLIDLHPLTQIWMIIHAFQVPTHSFFEYIKLAKVAIIHFLTSVKDDDVYHLLHF
jgi:hypothetical protein